MNHAVVTLGLPGAGKTHSARYLAGRLDAPRASLGEAVRRDARAELDGTVVGREIGDWLYGRYRERGTDPFREWVAGTVDDCLPAERVVVDGIRTPASLAHLRDRAATVTLVQLTAGFDARYERVRRRNRAGAARYGPDYLRRRDRRDLEYGLETLLTDESPDHRIVNEFDRTRLERALDEVVDELTETSDDGVGGGDDGGGEDDSVDDDRDGEDGDGVGDGRDGGEDGDDVGDDRDGEDGDA